MTRSSRGRPRRAAALLAMLSTVTLVAAACGGDDDDTDPAAGDPSPGEATDDAGDEPVEIRFSWWGSDSRHEQTQQIIEVFQ